MQSNTKQASKHCCLYTVFGKHYGHMSEQMLEKGSSKEANTIIEYCLANILPNGPMAEKISLPQKGKMRPK